MEASEDALVTAARSGDEAAFGALIDGVYPRLFRLAFAMLGNQAEAEDCAQDVCVTIARQLDRFEGRSAFSTWAHAITRNAATDRLRARNRRDRLTGDWRVLQAPGASVDDDLSTWLRQAMAALTPDLRATFALVIDAEMTHAQAAQALEVSEGTISWRMSEIRRLLKDTARLEGLT